MNLLEVAQLTEDQAREYLEHLRWPEGIVCPHCKGTDCTRMQGKTHRKGCSSKKGFSALQLQRELSLGSYKTAWFMEWRKGTGPFSGRVFTLSSGARASAW